MSSTQIEKFFLVNFLLIFLGEIFAENRNVFTGNRKLTNRFFYLNSSFKSLTIDGPFNVFLRFSPFDQSIKILTDENLQNFVEIKVENENFRVQLSIGVDVKFTELNLDLIFNKRLDSIYLKGLAFLQSQIDFIDDRRLTLNCQDTTSFNLTVSLRDLSIFYRSTDHSSIRGKIRNRTIIKYNGIGNLDAFDLFSRSVDLVASGLGTVMITGTENCFVKAEAVSFVKVRCFNKRQIEFKDLSTIVIEQ